MFTRRLPLLLALALCLTPALAHAQAADSRVRSMVRSAMEDYQNLEVDGAMRRLHLAARACENGGCSPRRLAEVHIAIGTVAIGGQNDSSTGINEFVEALHADANAQPDPELVTPEITAAFQQAQQRAGVGGGNGGNTGRGNGGNSGRGNNTSNNSGRGNGFTETDNGATRPSNGGNGSSGSGRTPAASSGTLRHTAWPEQLENTPLPVFVEPEGTQPAHVTLHYRGLGMSGYSDVAMSSIANGYGVEVPCGQVIQPYVEYYVTATDETGNVVATAGSAEAPSRVNVVHARTQPAPALPGRMPPEACGEDCPPGMDGPQCHHGGGDSGGGRGSRQMGDPCESNNQCATGLHCDAGACAAGEAGGNSGPPDAQYRFAFDLGGGMGAAWLPTGGARPSYAELAHYGIDGYSMDPTCGPPSAIDPSRSQFQCLDNNHISPGLAITPYLHLGVRVRVWDHLMVGVSMRFQPDAATTPPASSDYALHAPPVDPDTGARPGDDRRKFTLGNFLFAGRVYYALLPGGWKRDGFNIAPFLGGGVGQIQTRPAISGQFPSAHIVSGLGNINAGFHAEYGFAHMFHVGADLVFEFQVPTFLFVTDLQASVGMHF